MIPFLDLTQQTASLRPQLDEAIGTVLRDARFLGGDRLDEFECAFASYCGAREAAGVGSGTAAVTLALQALGIGPRDEVVTAANTCVATIGGIVGAGARPVLADVDMATATLDPGSLEDALTPRTGAVIPVHLYGQCADMEPVLAVARRHGLKVVEDAAHAHGAEYLGRRAGTLGDAAAFSFYPTKNLAALGDAGAVVTNDERLAAKVRLLRAHGEQARGHAVVRGTNSRLDELQAAFLLVKLEHLESWNERRRELAAYYLEQLVGTGVTLPVEAPGRCHVYHLFVVRVQDRARFRDALRERGVETLVHYPLPVHLQPAYAELARPGRLEVSERLCAEVVSLPLYPELTDAAAEAVVAAVRACAPEAVAL